MRWRRSRSERTGRTRSQRRALVRDRARQGLAILPSVLTLGNLLCGFYAIVHVGAVQWQGQAPLPESAFVVAAFAILLGMVFDMLDGRVARMTKSTSDFGAQLDSLADVVTFGVAPAVIVAMLHAVGRYDGQELTWSKMTWVFGAAYACAAATRLARFNVETASHDEDAHLVFNGLPSPAAAGVVATLVLLHDYLLRLGAESTVAAHAGLVVLNLLPFVALGAGYLMVSKFKYVHLANRYLKGRKPADYLSGMIFAGALAAMFPEVVAALCFTGFALSGPLLALRNVWRGQPAVEERAPSEEELAAEALEAEEEEDDDDVEEEDELEERLAGGEPLAGAPQPSGDGAPPEPSRAPSEGAGRTA